MNSGNEMLAKLHADAKEIEDQMDKMCKTLREDLECIRGTIAFYERKAKDKVSLEEFADTLKGTIPASQLRGLSHSDAVIAIAKYSGGVVRTQDAKRLMIKAGIMKQTKNSTNMAHNAINRTDKFERVRPGEYRLKSENQKAATESVGRIARMPFDVGTAPTQ